MEQKFKRIYDSFVANNAYITIASVPTSHLRMYMDVYLITLPNKYAQVFGSIIGGPIWCTCDGFSEMLIKYGIFI